MLWNVLDSRRGSRRQSGDTGWRGRVQERSQTGPPLASPLRPTTLKYLDILSNNWNGIVALVVVTV